MIKYYSPHLKPKNVLFWDLKMVARLYSVNNEEELALSYYVRSIEVLRSVIDPSFIVSLLNDVAMIHIRRRRFVEAVAVLQDAIECYDTASGPDPAHVRACEVIQIWRNLGECYFQLRDFKESVSALDSALTLQRDTRRAVESTTQQQVGTVAIDQSVPILATNSKIAETLRRLGKSYKGQGMYAEASSVLKEAIKIHRVVTAKADSEMKNLEGVSDLPAAQDELAASIFCLGEVCSESGDYDAAFKLFNDSFQLRLFSDANREGGRTNMVHCAMALVGMASVHVKKGELMEGSKVYSDALAYCDAHGVPDDNVIHRMIRDKLNETKELIKQKNKMEVEEGNMADLVILENEAHMHLKSGDLDKAIHTLTHIMATRRALLKLLRAQKRDSAKVKFDTACVLELFGIVLTRKGDYKHAIRAFGDAYKLFHACGDTARCDGIQEELDELQNLLQEHG